MISAFQKRFISGKIISTFEMEIYLLENNFNNNLQLLEQCFLLTTQFLHYFIYFHIKI